MIVNRNENYQPYFLAYLDTNNIQDGEVITKAYEYIFWIEAKHRDFKKLNNIPENYKYNDDMKEEFIKFIRRNK